jgi:hypothetical protein
MTTPNSTPQTSSGWRVTGTTETMLPDSTGRYVTGYQVSFLTGAGNSGTVFVPRDRFSPQSVQVAVAEHAATLDAINTLST